MHYLPLGLAGGTIIGINLMSEQSVRGSFWRCAAVLG